MHCSGSRATDHLRPEASTTMPKTDRLRAAGLPAAVSDGGGTGPPAPLFRKTGIYPDPLVTRSLSPVVGRVARHCLIGPWDDPAEPARPADPWVTMAR
jgi:hypothetical protein